LVLALILASLWRFSRESFYPSLVASENEDGVSDRPHKGAGFLYGAHNLYKEWRGGDRASDVLVTS